MRRRNRKKKLNVSVLSVPVSVTGVVIALVTLALAYVSVEIRCQSLGRELSALEQRRDELAKQLEQELNKWTTLKSPQGLQRALLANNLSMTWPSYRQVVRMQRIDESTGDPWEPVAQEQFASRE